MPEEEQYSQHPIMYGGNPAGYNESILRYQLDPEEYLQEIESKFLGKMRVRDPKTNQIILIDDPNTRALINERGWTRVKSHLKTGVDKSFSLTDLDPEMVERFTIDTGRNLIDMFYLHWEDFGIKSVTDASQMVRIVTNSIYANLRKSHYGTYLKFLTTTHSHHEQVNLMNPSQRNQQDPSARKQNILSKLMGRGS